MTAKNNNQQRATKFERIMAKEIIKGLWDKAYTDGVFKVDYKAEGELGKKKAASLHSALADYRKEVRKTQADNYSIFLKICACSLFRVDAYTIKIERKVEKFSNRTNVLLELAHNIPNLNLHESTDNLIDNITKDFNN